MPKSAAHPDPAKGAKLSPMMEQWHAIKAEHADKILFFRMGDFYEMFHDDAVKSSQLLGLVLTSRSKASDPVPMAGIPHHQLDRYLKELIQQGEKVAICDQLEDPAQAKGIVKRGVTRVVTPGTILEDSCLESHQNNFLCAVVAQGDQAGLAAVDISTGEFTAGQLDLEALGDELERLAPAETLLPRGAREGDLSLALRHRTLGSVTEREGWIFGADAAETALREHYGVQALDGFGLRDTPLAVGAAGAALAYLSETQMGKLQHLRTPRRVDHGHCLILDRTSQRNLELTHALLAGGKSQTLLGVLDRTRTGPGGRLLRRWLLEPLRELSAIQIRQEAVAELMEDAVLRTELREYLAGMADLERIMARVTTARANARELAALGQSAALLPGLAASAEHARAARLRDLTTDLDDLADLRERILATLVEEPSACLTEGNLIAAGVHPELDELRGVASGGKDWIAAFQAAEQERTGIPSLKIGFNKVFGYYIEVTHTHKEKVPEDYHRKQTLTNAERYITPALKERESQVLGAEERIVRLEYELFRELRDEVAQQVVRVQQVARALSELDALASLAEVAASRGYVIPEVHEGLETEIAAGRHPVLETMLPEGAFVANDTAFDPQSSRIQIITGPNMAGKSTYIRQIALIAIMAQMGCGVPATRARIGLVDRVFTRVGAADDLARGQSTFMVEMAETANILNNATARSLVILDEVGRGTSTFDGVSLAWAITEYLHKKVEARTVFATHYHELAELGLILKGAANYNVAVRDWGRELVFLHKIQEGSADRSYGIHVARLAGLPEGVIDRAREILQGLEGQAADRDWSYMKQGEVLRAAARDIQLDLFAPQAAETDAFVLDLAGLDPDRLTPIDALGKLHELVAEAKRKIGERS